MNLKQRKHHIVTGIGLLILIGFAVTNAVGQVTTQETGPSAINITTDSVTNVKETEATFQATLTGFDNTDYDAVLVYWNYSADSALDQKGGFTVENTEKQRSVLTPGLNPDTSYNVEAYAEPIVWNDPTLMDNYGEVIEGRYGGAFPSEFKPDLSQSYSFYDNSSNTNMGEVDEFDIGPAGENVVALDSDEPHYYTLSSPWDLSTASLVSDDYNEISDCCISEIHASPSGKRVAIVDDGVDIKMYTLSTPWDLTTYSLSSSYSLGPNVDTGEDIYFRPDGKKLFLSSDYDPVKSYSLGEAWNVSTAQPENTVDFGNGNNIEFSEGGTRMYLSDYNGIFEYDLSTPWDITTASATGSSSSFDEEYFSISPSGDRIITEYSGVLKGYSR